VVVAVAHDPDRLRRCLDSVERGAGEVPHEVVVVLNGADDDVVEASRTLPGARVVESRWNLGFAGACNLGRAHARGELIVVLHDDAEAESGWLPALVAAAERHPQAGVIGSRILTGDGVRLQLAGAAIFSDASTVLIGRGAPPGAPEYMAARPVDYCSSCSVLVRAETWDAIGGLDELLFPGGYVDADLGIAAREAGWSVRYEPASVVRHHQGGSTTGGFKAFAHGRNRDRLRSKWAQVLAAKEPPSDDVEAAAERALARVAEADAALARPVAPPAAEAGPSPDPDLGPRLATLELRMRREYIGMVDRELERVHRDHQVMLERLEAERERAAELQARTEELQERADTLDAILAGGWWRLRGRLLPLMRIGRRLGRRILPRRLGHRD
jgi:GT2 family glycosyltransferase